MFAVGDKIIYPLHGAGIIENIEDKEILGKIQKYYVMKLMSTGMSVMIPIDAEEVGLRSIIDSKKAMEIISLFPSLSMPPCRNWNQRYRENMNKLKEGKTIEVATVVKSLMERDRKKSLSTGERRMLISAKQILVSELMMATGKTLDEINECIDEALKKSIEE